MKKNDIYLRTLELKESKKVFKRKIKSFISKNIVLIILTFWGILCIFPFFWSIIASFNQPKWFYRAGINPIPEGSWTLQNYKTAFTFGPIEDYSSIWVINSFLFSFFVSLLSSTFNTFSGWVLAKMRMRGKKFLISYFLFVILIPGMIALMPIYIIYINLGLVSRETAPITFIIGIVIISSVSAGSALSSRQLFMTQSNETEEASYMAGYGKVKTFLKITLRKIFPIWLTSFITGFMAGWNAFFIFMLYSTGDYAKLNLYTGITQLGRTMTDRSAVYGAMIALSNVTMVPMVIIYFLTINVFMPKSKKKILRNKKKERKLKNVLT